MASVLRPAKDISRWESGATPSMTKISKSDRWRMRLATLPSLQFPRVRQLSEDTSMDQQTTFNSLILPSLMLDTSPSLPVREQSEEFMIEHSTTKGASQQRPPLPRRVRFAMYEKANGRRCPVDKVFIYPVVSSVLYGDCYWSRKEIFYFRCFQKEVARHYKRHCGDGIAESIAYLYRSDDQSAVFETDGDMGGSMTEAKAIDNLKECNTRGLEHFMCKTFHKHRRWAIDQVLQTQESCRGMDPEASATLLRECCEAVSASSTRFARMVAECDEFLVKENRVSMTDSGSLHRGRCELTKYAVCA